ncbi:MAG: hypothetical protein DCF16_16110 [Alphaproteobacteria bacterium]|nr:MAG: hypothetical protein DCF16_16110 [Alphaproteobacteria bacterium]
MKRFLLTTAAVVVLTLVAPLAIAQSSMMPLSDIQTVQAPVGSQSTRADQSLAPGPGTRANSAITAPRAIATGEAMSAPDVAATGDTDTTPDTLTTQSALEAEPSRTHSDQAETATTGRPGLSHSEQDGDQAARSTVAPQYGARIDQHANTMFEPAALQDAARDAGMAGTPMSAAEVCAVRQVDLGSVRLTQDTRRQLRFAADRASACEIDQIMISAPRGGAQALRQVLIEQGVDAADIQVQEARELSVAMRFTGVATSSAHYASVFNPSRQLAMNDAAPAGSFDGAPDQSPTQDEERWLGLSEQVLGFG